MLGWRSRVEGKLVWIFGSPRSGSTWLLNLLAAAPQIGKVDELAIGSHLGISAQEMVGLQSSGERPFRLLDLRAEAADYIFAEARRADWEQPLRDLVLRRLRPDVRNRRWLAIKEPHGSDAADLLMSVLPRSRMIFLLRDGRDVVDSTLDAASEGSFTFRAFPDLVPVSDRLSFIRGRALAWLRRTEIVQRAYAEHPPERRRLVKYEELRAEPERVLSELAGWLSIDEEPLQKLAAATAFEKLQKTGRGEFVRAASPGMWRQNLSGEEQSVLRELLDAKVRELYG